MITEVETGGRRRRFDLARACCIGLPLIPGGPNPHFFTDEEVAAEPLRSGDFTGSVTAGGSCNASVVTLAPHCHGTHTESAGHIDPDAADVHACLDGTPLTAQLISVDPVAAGDCDETYVAELPANSPLIPRRALAGLTRGVRALVLRTRPNDPDKRRRDYGAAPEYPVLTTAAAEFIVAHGIEHLYLDTPSLDCAADGGRLGIHRLFWGMGGNNRQPGAERAHCTITEMIFVPDDLADGHYLLWPGLSPLAGEATPSSPWLIPET